MDDFSQTSRPPHRAVLSRPESSLSTHTRMTPTSSSNNSSSTHLPRSNQSARGSSGGTSLLQERLRERKVESARMSSRQVSEVGDREVQSSPVRPQSIRDERRPSSSGMGVGPKSLGVKQVEEQVSTLHKQNFDLKLEVHHRRERQAALEQQLEAAEKRLDDQSELQEVNEQLLAELEKRDQAVEEAVSIICNLEDRIARLMQEREVVRNFDTAYNPRPRKNREEISSSPPQALTTNNVKSMIRMPSFLSEQSEGTDALRSLYIPSSVSVSDAGIPKLPEADGLNSPRLSVLSESSFVSVYGDKTLQLDGEKAETIPERRHRKTSSVEKWIDERSASTKAANSMQTSPQRRLDKYLSIDDVIVSPLQRMEKLRRQMEQQHASVVSWQTGSPNKQRQARDALRRVRTDAAAKEPTHPNPLPPTPDTISTSTLRHYQLSSEQLAQQSALAASYSNNPTTLARIGSRPSLRPRSAGETVTSRREGHGWDTETQDDGLSISSGGTAESYDLPVLRQPQGSLNPPPSLFDFSSSVHEWGQDMMLNDPSRYQTSASALRYQKLRDRRASIHEPRSDDTVMPSFNRSTTNTTPRKPTYSREATDTTLENDHSPAPPDRRSSLAATTRVRKPSSSQQSSLPMPSSSSSINPNNSLTRAHSKSKKASGRLSLFGRANDERPEEKDERELRERENDRQRATPPPIMRNRNVQAWRPASSGGERGFGSRFVEGLERNAGGSGRRRENNTGLGMGMGMGMGTGLDGAGDVVEGVIASNSGVANGNGMSCGNGGVKGRRLSVDVVSLEKGEEFVGGGGDANAAADARRVGKKRWFGMGSLKRR